MWTLCPKLATTIAFLLSLRKLNSDTIFEMSGAWQYTFEQCLQFRACSKDVVDLVGGQETSRFCCSDFKRCKTYGQTYGLCDLQVAP